MEEPQAKPIVKELSPDRVFRNEENPRLIFRSEELDLLLASISRYGIQVPITVYQDGERYVLIDGERRWRCARKLNLPKIPALVQPKPTELNNLLLMFNIHALREQWDYVTIANKLPRVIELHVKKEGVEPNEVELSNLTGLTRGQIRRCRLILDLPAGYRDQLLTELELPKNKQRLSEDFFIEMERAIRTIQNRVPGAIKNIDKARNVLIKKYRDHKINNITDFRKLSKIATSIRGIGVEEEEARDALAEIFDPKGPSIEQVFTTRFTTLYDEQKVERQLITLLGFLSVQDTEELNEPDKAQLKGLLVKLSNELNRLLEQD